MPKDLSGLAGLAGFAREFGPQFVASQRQQLEQERKGRQDEIQNLEKTLKLIKDYYPDDPRIISIADQLIEMRGGAPRQQRQVPPIWQITMPAVEPFAGRLREAGTVPSPITTPKAMREEARVTGEVAARIPKAPTVLSALRTRLTSLYDREKKKAVALDAQIATKRLTLPEPKAGPFGIFSNQAEIDSIQSEIDILKQQRGKIQSNMDRVVSEGRKRFGEDIIFGIPGQVTPTGLLSREDFIQDFKREEGREPTERDLNMLQGIVWE